MGALILLLLVTTRRIRQDALEQVQAKVEQPQSAEQSSALEISDTLPLPAENLPPEANLPEEDRVVTTIPEVYHPETLIPIEPELARQRASDQFAPPATDPLHPLTRRFTFPPPRPVEKQPTPRQPMPKEPVIKLPQAPIPLSLKPIAKPRILERPRVEQPGNPIAHSPAVNPNVKLADELLRLKQRKAERERQLTLQNDATANKEKQLNELQRLNAAIAEQKQEQDEALRKVEVAAKTLETQQRRLRLRVDDAKENLKAIQQASSVVGQGEFTIVPFHGKTGTRRTPILLECTSHGIRFIPEDVLITERHINGFTPGYNPLLIATREVSRYWHAKRNSQGQQSTPEPYVLLVVRPSGTKAYYIARQLLNHLREDFGYELIESDIQLHLPTVDPQARKIIQEAIDQTISERDQIVASVQGSGLGMGEGNAGFRAGSSGQNSSEFGASRSGRPGSTGLGREERHQFGNSSGSHDGITSRNATAAASQRRHDPKSPFKVRSSDNMPRPDDSPRTRTEHRNEGAFSRGPFGQSGGFGRPNRLADASGELRSVPTIPSIDDIAADPLFDSGSDSGGQARHRQQGEVQNGDPNGTPNTSRNVNFGSQARSTDGPVWRSFGSRGGIGFEKDVVINVQDDRIIAGQRVLRIRPGEQLDDVMPRLMNLLDASIRDWGQPPRRFYWVPNVRLRVESAEFNRYQALRNALERSGLKTSIELIRQEGRFSGGRQ